MADPENYVLNRLQLENTSLPGTTVTIGRQRIVLDDQRFVGNSGWRQNEVTYDAVRLVNTSIRDLTIDLTHLDKVHRVYGVDSPQGTYTGGSTLVNLRYASPLGRLTGFAYLIGFDPIAGLTGGLDPRRGSTSTYGARLAGEWPVGAARWGYVASYATQEARGDNPLDLTNAYALAELHASAAGFTLTGGDENMHGNGVAGFATPLATAHLFDGWVDKFLTTPADGLDDRYGSLAWNRRTTLGLASLTATLVYRGFRDERLGTSFGREWDGALAGRWRRYTALLQYGSYRAAPDTPPAVARSAAKFWAQLEYLW